MDNYFMWYARKNNRTFSLASFCFLCRPYILFFICTYKVLKYFFNQHILKGQDNREYLFIRLSFLLRLHCAFHRIASPNKGKATIRVCGGRVQNFKGVFMAMQWIRIIMLLAACLLPLSVEGIVRHYKFNVGALHY